MKLNKLINITEMYYIKIKENINTSLEYSGLIYN